MAEAEKKTTQKEKVDKTVSESSASSNKGIGPIKSITLSKNIDQAMAAKGCEIYKAKCTACHKLDKKYIGGPLKGVLAKRSPEWLMNMIINPEEMVKKDKIARQLLIEFNNAPMVNQNLSENEARWILEYLRTLK